MLVFGFDMNDRVGNEQNRCDRVCGSFGLGEKNVNVKCSAAEPIVANTSLKGDGTKLAMYSSSVGITAVIDDLLLKSSSLQI